MINKNLGKDTSLSIELNNTVKEFETKADSDVKSICFYDGNFFEVLPSTINSVVPLSKVVCFYGEKTFIKYAKKINDCLSKLDIKVQNFIVNEELSVENSLKYIPALEDARAILVLDKCCYEMAEYLCHANGIKLFVLVNSLDYRGICSSRLTVKNGSDLDFIKINVERHIFIDLNYCIEKDDRAECFGYIMGKALSLYDYRILCAIKNIKFNSYAYQTIRQTVQDTYKITSYSFNNQYVLLMKNLMKLEISNYFAGGEIFDFDSENCFRHFIKNYTAKDSIFFLKVASKLFKLVFDCKYDKVLSIDTKTQIATDILPYTYGSEKQLFESLLRQGKLFNYNYDKLKQVRAESYKDIVNIVNSLDNIEKIYILLNGKTYKAKEDKLIFAIKHCGDLPFTFNGFTLLREIGALKYIE